MTITPWLRIHYRCTMETAYLCLDHVSSLGTHVQYTFQHVNIVCLWYALQHNIKRYECSSTAYASTKNKKSLLQHTTCLSIIRMLKYFCRFCTLHIFHGRKSHMSMKSYMNNFSYKHYTIRIK